MISAVLTTAALLASYDCQLEAPRALSFDGANVTASVIGMATPALSFSLTFESGRPDRVAVKWPGDPFQIAGKFPVITSAPGSYAFSAFSAGPCLFTEQACLSQVNLVDAGGGKANVIVAPVALASDKKAGTRSPFTVIARGQCTRTDLKR